MNIWKKIKDEPPPKGRSLLLWVKREDGTEYWTHGWLEQERELWDNGYEYTDKWRWAFGCEGHTSGGVTPTHWMIPDAPTNLNF